MLFLCGKEGMLDASTFALVDGKGNPVKNK
jgi:hypothetical protein